MTGTGWEARPTWTVQGRIAVRKGFMRFSLPGSDEVLLLTPRWGDAEGTFATWALLAALIQMTGLLIWLFRWEARLIRRSTAAILLTLRLLVIAVLVFVACF